MNRVFRTIVPALALTAILFALTGCSGNAHQVVTDKNACLSCHAAGFAVDESASYKMTGAVYSATGQVGVVVSGTKWFYVCRAVGTTVGSNKPPVPILLHGPITITEGEPHGIVLDPGNYLIVAQEGGVVRSQLLVVDPNTTEKPVNTITLKL